MASDKLVTVTDSNFDSEVLKSAEPVLIDFWATWCGPCRTIAPIIDALANDYAGQVKVGKVDVDHNQGVATQYGVTSIPTLLVFKGGKVVGHLMGSAPRPKIEEMLKKAIA